MVPVARYLWPEVPTEKLLWQDPLPEVTHEFIDAHDMATLKGQVLESGLSVSQLVSAAWASAVVTSAAAPTARGSASSRRTLGGQRPRAARDGAARPSAASCKFAVR